MGTSNVAARALNLSGTLVWRLQGLTSGPMECWISLTGASLYALSLQRRTETVVGEMYPDKASALSRAGQIRDLLIDSGSWTDVPENAWR